jgi:hypothetical protein
MHADPGVKEAVRRSEEFHLNDSALYYFNSIDRIAAVNYVPTDQDIIRSRVKTTGLTEMTFRVRFQLAVPTSLSNVLHRLASLRTRCSTSAASGRSGESGFIASKT